jgi:uncharacterized protein YbaP (TraB family)
MKRALFVTMTAVLGLACKQSAPAPTADKTPAPAPAQTQKPAPAAPPTAAAPAADPWTKAAPKKDPLPHPLFWSIEKDGKTSYALGTIHVGVDPESRLPQVVWDKLDGEKDFAMETDLSDPALMKVLECNKCSLKRDLGPTYWKKLEDVITPAVAAKLEPMKPMVAATMMSMRGLPMTTQMDTLLLARAQNAKKGIVFLEEAKAEAAVLEKWMDVKALKAMLDDIEGNDKHTKEMLDAYVAGDVDRMIKLSDDEKAEALKHGYSQKEYDEQMQDMLYSRNASWIPAIEKAHAEGGVFIAVGAMHLMGEKSVLELLQKKGYKVTRVEPK